MLLEVFQNVGKGCILGTNHIIININSNLRYVGLLQEPISQTKK